MYFAETKITEMVADLKYDVYGHQDKAFKILKD
jgi:hypothetical protein